MPATATKAKQPESKFAPIGDMLEQAQERVREIVLDEEINELLDLGREQRSVCQLAGLDEDGIRRTISRGVRIRRDQAEAGTAAQRTAARKKLEKCEGECATVIPEIDAQIAELEAKKRPLVEAEQDARRAVDAQQAAVERLRDPHRFLPWEVDSLQAAKLRLQRTPLAERLRNDESRIRQLEHATALRVPGEGPVNLAAPYKSNDHDIDAAVLYAEGQNLDDCFIVDRKETQTPDRGGVSETRTEVLRRFLPAKFRAHQKQLRAELATLRKEYAKNRDEYDRERREVDELRDIYVPE